MLKFKTNFFVALKLSSSHKERKDSVMVRVATFSIAICICVMLISTFIVRGFQSTISSKITGLISHIDIVDFENKYSDKAKPVTTDLPYLKKIDSLPSVKNIFPYITRGGIIKSTTEQQGMLLRGFNNSYDTTLLSSYVINGRLPNFESENKHKEILISKTIAQNLNVKIGDKLDMLFIEKIPLRDRFKVVGIYDTSFKEYDDINIITNIRAIQRLNNWKENEVSGISIELNSIDDIESADDEIYDIIYNNRSAETSEITITIKERYGEIFEWLKMQDINERIIMIIMIIVSAFNMITMMLILILQKTSMIGVFKSLGMRNSTIRSIFIIRLSRIMLWGLFYGNAIALLLSYLQIKFKLIKLSADSYMLSEVPMLINFSDVLLINITTFIGLTLLQIIPTMLISRLSPYKCLKYVSGVK